MSNIPIKSAIDDSGAFYPESHERAITDDNGTTLESKLQKVKNPVLTLNSAPTSSTLTHTEGGVTYTFKVGDEVRVRDTEKGTAEGNYYVFYTLKDKSNNTAYWEESGSSGGVATNTYSVLIDSNQSDKTDLANARVTYGGVMYASGATVSVPHSIAITVSDLTVTSITGYSVDVQVSGWNIIVTYSTEILTVTITADEDASNVSACTITVSDGIGNTLGTLTSGQSLKVPYGVNYVCTPSAAPTNYYTLSSTTKDWSDTASKSLTFTYICHYTDLGLSVKWAKGIICKDSNGNYYIGQPTDCGCYYSRGNIIGHNKSEEYTFDSNTYSSTPGSSISTSTSIASNDSAHDAALACLGSGHRLPTNKEGDELIDNCDVTWVTSYNGVAVAGAVFKSKKTGYTDKEIFIPAFGYYNGTSLNKDSVMGCSWTSGANANYNYPYDLRVSEENANCGFRTAYYGLQVRPVQ